MVSFIHGHYLFFVACADRSYDRVDQKGGDYDNASDYDDDDDDEMINSSSRQDNNQWCSLAGVGGEGKNPKSFPILWKLKRGDKEFFVFIKK